MDKLRGFSKQLDGILPYLSLAVSAVGLLNQGLADNGAPADLPQQSMASGHHQALSNEEHAREDSCLPAAGADLVLSLQPSSKAACTRHSVANAELSCLARWLLCMHQCRALQADSLALQVLSPCSW